MRRVLGDFHWTTILLLILSTAAAVTAAGVVVHVSSMESRLDVLYSKEASYSTNRLTVELANFERHTALSLYENPDYPARADYRLWYDVLWNRLDILANAPIYRTVPEFADQVDQIDRMRALHASMEPVFGLALFDFRAARADIQGYFAAFDEMAKEAAKAGDAARRKMVRDFSARLHMLYLLLMALVAIMITSFGVLLFQLIRQAARSEDGRRQMEELSLSLENALTNARALNETKDNFLAHMSHEFRTPLNAILGYSEFIDGDADGRMAARYREYAGSIHQAGSRLLEFVNQLFDLSRLTAVGFQIQPVPTDVIALLEDARALSLAASPADRSVRVHLTVTPEPLRLEIDPRALTQLVVNLLTNALKFSPDGSVVTLEARTLNGDRLRISVADRGQGMTEAEIANMFDPFWQSKGTISSDARGTTSGGLGLHICRQLIDAQCGEYTVTSAPGQGTTVTVILPAAPVKRPVGDQAATAESSA
jgi:signal transduction histidine kinase